MIQQNEYFNMRVTNRYIKFLTEFIYGTSRNLNKDPHNLDTEQEESLWFNKFHKNVYFSTQHPNETLEEKEKGWYKISRRDSINWCIRDVLETFMSLFRWKEAIEWYILLIEFITYKTNLRSLCPEEIDDNYSDTDSSVSGLSTIVSSGASDILSVSNSSGFLSAPGSVSSKSSVSSEWPTPPRTYNKKKLGTNDKEELKKLIESDKPLFKPNVQTKKKSTNKEPQQKKIPNYASSGSESDYEWWGTLGGPGEMPRQNRKKM